VSERLVLRTDVGAVTWLILSRPEKLNAVNSAMLMDLRSHLEAIATDESVRCVVLGGAGRSFCAGKDLLDVRDGEGYDPRRDAATVDLLEALPQPTIGRIHGHCFTGGLELVLACDLLVAADDARMGDTHARYGIIPLWGMSVRLPERVGLAVAKRMMFTSAEVSGTEAAALGLVDRAVPAAELDQAVGALAEAIAAGSADSNRIVKRTLGSSPLRSARADALEFERSRPFGVPRDRAERLAAAVRR
jgi:enoyl-CoA hydratase/carnithine racemase